MFHASLSVAASTALKLPFMVVIMMCVYDIISATCDLQVSDRFYLCFRGTGCKQEPSILQPGGRVQQLPEAQVLQHEVDLRWDTDRFLVQLLSTCFLQYIPTPFVV